MKNGGGVAAQPAVSVNDGAIHGVKISKITERKWHQPRNEKRREGRNGEEISAKKTRNSMKKTAKMAAWRILAAACDEKRGVMWPASGGEKRQ
jgi:hypothetical protein